MRSDAKTLASWPVAPRLAAIKRPTSSGLRDPTSRQPRAALCLWCRHALRAELRKLVSAKRRRIYWPKPGKARRAFFFAFRVAFSTRSSSARHTRDARSRLDALSHSRTTRHPRPVSLPRAVSLARARCREPARDRVAFASEKSAAAVQVAADRAPRLADRPFA